MRALLVALMLMFGSQVWAECGNLCDWGWWKTATDADVQSELNAGGGVIVQTEDDGWTPLHTAAGDSTPANIQALLDAGADVMARDRYGSTPLHWTDSPEGIQALLGSGLID